MASLGLYPSFEINLMPNSKVIELLLQLKGTKAHKKTTQKSDHTLFSIIICFLPNVICYAHKQIDSGHCSKKFY